MRDIITFVLFIDIVCLSAACSVIMFCLSAACSVIMLCLSAACSIIIFCFCLQRSINAFFETTQESGGDSVTDGGEGELVGSAK